MQLLGCSGWLLGCYIVVKEFWVVDGCVAMQLLGYSGCLLGCYVFVREFWKLIGCCYAVTRVVLGG